MFIGGMLTGIACCVAGRWIDRTTWPLHVRLITAVIIGSTIGFIGQPITEWLLS